MRDFENIKSQDKPVLNNANNKTIPLEKKSRENYNRTPEFQQAIWSEDQCR